MVKKKYKLKKEVKEQLSDILLEGLGIITFVLLIYFLIALNGLIWSI